MREARRQWDKCEMRGRERAEDEILQEPRESIFLYVSLILVAQLTMMASLIGASLCLIITIRDVQE